MRSARNLGCGLAAVLMLAACGSDAADSTPAPTQPAPVAEPGDEAPVAASSDSVSGSDSDADVADSDVADHDFRVTEPTTPVPDDSGSDTTDASSIDDVRESHAPEISDPPPNEATSPEPAPVGGRELGNALDPASASDSNPLPDLIVDDVGRDAEVNVANIIPSQRPVLVWAWAPH